MKNKIIICTVFILLSANLFASGGSLYSRFGMGDLYHSNSAMQLSLGGIGTSLNSSKYVNIANPASIYNIEFTRFGAGVSSYSSILDDGTENALYSQVKFSGFHLAFPIKRDLGIGFILGMTPYSVVNYEVINNTRSDISGEYTEQFKGIGGLSKIFLGFSYLLPGDLAFGATFNYYTGNIQHRSTYLYADSLNLFDSYFSNESQYKGLGTTLGLESPNLAKVFDLEGVSDFRIGVTYEINAPVTTDSSIIAQTTVGENTFRSGKFETTIPAKLGIGLNLALDERYIFVFDYVYQPWSEYEKNGFKSSYLRNLTRYSVGFEYGDQTKRFATFWELIKYRCGLSYEQSQYQINGDGINQFGIHGGVSLPLGLDNSIDVGLMYGIRGTTDNNLLKENIIQASISLNFGEFWFVRQER